MEPLVRPAMFGLVLLGLTSSACNDGGDADASDSDRFEETDASAGDTLPGVEDVSVSVEEDGELSFDLPGDAPSGGELRFAVLVEPTHGLLRVVDRTAIYAPEPDFNGEDTFDVEVSDGERAAELTVTVTVTPVNDAPISDETPRETEEDASLEFTLEATDIDSEALVYEVTGQPTFGTIDGTPPTVTWIPDPDFTGTDSFTYEVSDGEAVDEGTVSLRATPVPDAPVADSLMLTTDEDTSLALPLSGSDADGDRLTFRIVDAPERGRITGSTGNLSWTPDPDDDEDVTFTYVAEDAALESVPATVNITVNPVPDAPVAIGGTRQGEEDIPVSLEPECEDADGDVTTVSWIEVPAVGGELSEDTGSWLWTPPLNQNGRYAFRFNCSDGQFTSGASTLTVDVAPAPDAPEAVGDLITLDEDTPAAVTLVASDPDGDALLYDVTLLPSHGTLEGSVPDLTYVPDGDYAGPDAIRFTASDGGLTSSEAEIVLAITSVPDAPVAVSRELSTQEDTPVSVTLAGSDGDGDTLTFEVVDPPDSGALTGEIPDLTWTPGADDTGDFFFTYRAFDGALYSEPARVDLAVAPVQDPPTVESRTVRVDEDDTILIALDLADPDADDTLSIRVSGGPLHGEATVEGSSVLYEPEANYNGDDGFDITVSDGTDEASARITIEVTPVNDPPTLSRTNDGFPEDTVWSSTLVGSDVDEDTLTYRLVSPPEVGEAVVETDGGVTYSPPANFNGKVLFTVAVSDGTVEATALVDLLVTSRADAPVLECEPLTVTEDEEAAVVFTVSDVDGDATLVSVSQAPSLGEVVADGSGGFLYRPDKDQTGEDVFRLSADDPLLSSVEVACAVVILPVDDPPTITGAEVTVVEDGSWEADLSSAAQDADGDELTFLVVSEPAHGSLEVSPEGLATYAPDANYAGPDGFEVEVSDGTPGDEATGAWTISVKPVNDDPVVLGSVSAVEDTPIAFDPREYLTDVDGDVLVVDRVTLVDGESGALLEFPTSSGGVLFTPPTDASGTFEMSVRVVEQTPLISPFPTPTLVIPIEVAPVNDPPFFTGEAQPLTTNEVETATWTASAEDVDDAQDALRLTVVAPPSRGTLTVDGLTASYTPGPGGVGEDAFEVDVCDDEDLCSGSPVLLAVTITEYDPVPVVQDELLATAGNLVLVSESPGVLANDSDPEGVAFAGAVSGAPTTLGGTIDLAADGGFTYLPPIGVGDTTDTFTYTVFDEEGGQSATGTLSIRLGTVVWFVDAAAGTTGTGRSNAPFQTLTEAASVALSASVISATGGDYGCVDVPAGVSLFGDDAPLVLEEVPVMLGSSGRARLNVTGEPTYCLGLASGSAATHVDVLNPLSAGVRAVEASGVTLSHALVQAGGDGVVLTAGENATISDVEVSTGFGTALRVQSWRGGLITRLTVNGAVDGVSMTLTDPGVWTFSQPVLEGIQADGFVIDGTAMVGPLSLSITGGRLVADGEFGGDRGFAADLLSLGQESTVGLTGLSITGFPSAGVFLDVQGQAGGRPVRLTSNQVVMDAVDVGWSLQASGNGVLVWSGRSDVVDGLFTPLSVGATVSARGASRIDVTSRDSFFTAAGVAALALDALEGAEIRANLTNVTMDGTVEGSAFSATVSDDASLSATLSQVVSAAGLWWFDNSGLSSVDLGEVSLRLTENFISDDVVVLASPLSLLPILVETDKAPPGTSLSSALLAGVLGEDANTLEGVVVVDGPVQAVPLGWTPTPDL